ncbi:hypothetical protein IDM40_21975 [Nocardiopsis sp. HNM0947]|uniref:Uncharacterized protein n=1 Tax=Nocardiopsis coralli TaxID=2772213 RepID=A0ABR9PBY0_9ACTN|nr:hypothetical protein [Nocardiopsis coralli]MBE3001339.1 hypothetical protein [Nocardiopsis coralli]
MGYDAYVPCHCWRDGLTTPPPADPSLIQPDEESGLPDLDVPITGNEELHHRFDRWTAREACPHEEMELIAERIANSGGMGRLRRALDGAGGAHRFPTLVNRLPQANSGRLENEEAASMLAELRDLSRSRDLGPWTVLTSDTSGTGGGSGPREESGADGLRARPIHEHLGAGRSRRMPDRSAQYVAGLDHDGFFVEYCPERAEDGGCAEDGTRTELFRSRRFTQQRVGEDRVRFTALDHGGETTVPMRHLLGRGGQEGREPDVLGVHRTRLPPQELEYAVAPLTRLCRAAVETGGCVHWC